MAATRKQSDRRYAFFALRIMGELIYIIAAPVVVFALLGKWLDSRFSTAPIFLIIGFVIAAIISAVLVSRRARELGKEFQALDVKNSESKNSSQ